MYRKWMCLLLALLIWCAPLTAALGEDVLIPEDAGEEVMPVELEANLCLASVEDELAQALETPEMPEPEASEPSEDAEDVDETEAAEEAGGTAQEIAAPEEPGESEAPALTLSAKALTIGVKEKCTRLTATLTPSGNQETVAWTSNKPKIAAVNSKTGAITGVKAGTAVITASTASGLSARCKVAVKKAPDKVTLDQTALILYEGETCALKASLPSGTGSTLTYTSKNKKIATVDEVSGLVTAVAPGSTTVTVKTFNNKKATCQITVVAEPDQVTLPATLTIAQRERKTLVPKVVDANGNKSVATYTFTAENGTGAITVDSKTGEVVGVSVGNAWVRVSTHNGVTTHLSRGERVETVCAVTVVEGPAEVSLAAQNVTIGLKQTCALQPVILGSDGNEMAGAKYTVSSSDSKKVSVTSKGVIKGLAKGTCTVTVTAFNGVSSTCKVKVVNAPSKVTLSPKKPVLGLGQTAQLKASFPSGSMASCTFSSSNKNVVTVDNDGNVTGVKEGSAVVKVRTHNSKTATVTVTVTRGPAFLTLNGTYELVYDELTDSYSVVYTKSLEVGKTFQITYENEYGTYGSIKSFESDNPEVATVSEKGLVRAITPGVASILMRSTGGAEATLLVTVPGTPPAKISFGAAGMSIQAGKSAAVPALRGTNITAAALARATYESDDADVFTVAFSDEENRWLITGVNPGASTLTAVAGGTTAYLQVTVSEATGATKIAFEDSLLYMKPGETYTPCVLDDNDRLVSAELSSSAPEVVSVDEEGRLCALSEGNAEITATFGELTAGMTAVVRAEAATVTLDVNELTLGVGQRYALKARVNGDGSSSMLKYASSKPSVATVTASGVVIARAAGQAMITVTESGGVSALCAVTVGEAPTKLVLEPASVSARLNTGGAQLKWSFGASGEVGSVTFSSSNDEIASVNDDGYISFNAVGAAVITAVTNNGMTASVDVTVLPDRETTDDTTYRLFAAYSYHDELPFTQRNARSVAGVFGKSSIGGQTYSTRVIGNPSKVQILSGITSYFANTDDNDVSIVYLCSHGHNNSSSYTNYRLSLPGYASYPNNANYYLTSKEIFNCVKRIKGDVVLILDSCYSGTFIQDMKGKLDAEGGRIAVLTAASNTRATFYNVKKKAVDFFTFFMLQGLGYNEREEYWTKDSKGNKGSYPGYLAADKTGNNDGAVTLGEMFDFASKCIAANIPSYMSKSWYWGEKSKVQAPRFYAGKLKNLVVYQPKG